MKNHFVALLIILLINTLYAQPLPQKALEIPGIYNAYVVNEEPLVLDDKLPTKVWVVWSAYDDNQTYSSPGGSTKTRLKFLDWFYVVEESNGYLRLVKDDKINGIILSSEAHDFGWIKYDKLLLWKNCLQTGRRLSRKAMILNNIGAIRTQEDLEKNTVEFKTSPEANARNADYQANLFDFYYVYKTTEQYMLLGRDPRIDYKERIGDNIKGWVPKTRITAWDHRIAVEPNWEEAAKQERSNKKKTVFFGDEVSALAYAEGSLSNSTVIWNSDPYGIRERPVGEWRRFPLLKRSELDSNVFQAGVMGQVLAMDVSGNKDYKTAEKTADEQHKVNARILSRRNINIVFVVDGTLSISTYLPTIQRSIKSSEIDIKARFPDNEIRFGGVVYRDYEEAQQYWREVRPIDLGNAADWFIGKAYHSKDSTAEERPFYGIEGAVIEAGLKKDETNLIIIIGDAGNHDTETRVNRERLIDRLALLECHIIAFQVHHEAHVTYDKFIEQMRDILYQVSDKNLSGMVTELEQQGLPIHPRWEKLGDTYYLREGNIGGAIYGLSNSQKMDPSRLGSAIIDYIRDFNQYTENVNKEIDKIIIAGGNTDLSALENSEEIKHTSSMAHSIVAFLKSCGLTAEDMKFIEKKKFQLYVQGYSTYIVPNQMKPLYKNVLFLSYPEFSQLLTDLRELNNAATAADERDALYDWAMQLLKSYLGTGKSKSELENMPMKVVMEKLSGLPSKSKFLKNVKLVDIKDPGAFPDAEFRNWVQQITKTLGDLEAIYFDEKFPRRFMSNGKPYFWIDEDLLP